MDIHACLNCESPCVFHLGIPFLLTVMQVRPYHRAVCFVVLPLLLLWFAVLPGNMPCYNFALETIGWHKIVLDRCILYQKDRPKKDSPLIFAEIARLYKSMGEFDQSLEIYKQEFVPWSNKIFEDSLVLHKNSNVPFHQVATMAGHLSDLYRIKGEYQKSLDLLTQTRVLLLRCDRPSIPYWLQLYTLKDKIKRMTRLVRLIKWQEEYTAALVRAAHRPFLSTDVLQEANQVETCPAKGSDRFRVNSSSSSLRGKSYYSLIKLLFFLLHSSSKWIQWVGIVSMASVVVLARIWNQLSVIEQLNGIARAFSMGHQNFAALLLYEEARCEILANPYEEIILVSETGVETFIGAMLVYSELNWDQKVIEMAETIRDLVNIRNSAFGRQDEPNDSAIIAFQTMSSKYSLLGNTDLANAFQAFAEGKNWKKVGKTTSLATGSEPMREYIIITSDHVKVPISHGEL
jgi:tetratricopeptide (TPR) repeat protein